MGGTSLCMCLSSIHVAPLHVSAATDAHASVRVHILSRTLEGEVEALGKEGWEVGGTASGHM